MTREASRRRVLVIDDDDDMRMVVRVTLELDGYDVVAAEGADQALSLIEKTSPDVVVTDVMMPGTSGIELLARLRAREDTSTMPVLIYTCLDTPEVAKAVARTHRVASLVKPATPRALGAAVAALIAPA